MKKGKHRRLVIELYTFSTPVLDIGVQEQEKANISNADFPGMQIGFIPFLHEVIMT